MLCVKPPRRLDEKNNNMTLSVSGEINYKAAGKSIPTPRSDLRRIGEIRNSDSRQAVARPRHYDIIIYFVIRSLKKIVFIEI